MVSTQATRLPGVKEARSSLRRLLAKYNMHRQLFLLFVPVIVYFIVFKYIPMYGVTVAFKDYRLRSGILGSPWVGFEHFRLMFAGRTFREVLRNTIVISFYRLVFGFPAPILFALLLNEIRNMGFKKVVQTISYLPHFLSWIVLAGVFFPLLSPSIGPINYAIRSLGFKPIFFLGDPGWFRFTIVTTGIWQDVGWGSIIYLATLSGVDPELYEAAEMDGAGRLAQAIHISVPSLLPVITIMFILAVGRLLADDFDQIFNLYNPVVYSTGDVISTYVYRTGLIGLKYDFAAAVGLFRNVIGFALVFVTNAIVKKVNEYGIW
jgi:putative aldouronate transport system permease protein